MEDAEPEVLTPARGRSPWVRELRLKKRLMLVCRAWYAAVVPFLYSRVLLHRVGQLISLVNTLEMIEARSTPLATWCAHSSYARFIREVRIAFYIPEDWRDVYCYSTLRLLELCSNLRVLSHEFLWDERIEPSSQSSLLGLLCDPSVRQQGIALDSPYALFPIPQIPSPNVLASLEWLSIRLSGPAGYEHLSQKIMLPLLHTLVFHLDTKGVLYGLSVMARHWALPSLNFVEFGPDRLADQHAEETSVSVLHIVNFCLSHGTFLRGIHFADFRTPSFKDCREHGLLEVLSACPSLENLSVAETLNIIPAADVSLRWDHQRLRHVELRVTCHTCEYTWKRSLENRLRELSNRSFFPGLKTIIISDSSLVHSRQRRSVASLLQRWMERLQESGIALMLYEGHSSSVLYGVRPDLCDAAVDIRDYSYSDAPTGWFYDDPNDSPYRPRRNWHLARESCSDDDSEGDTDSLMSPPVERRVPSQLDFREAIEVFEETTLVSNAHVPLHALPCFTGFVSARTSVRFGHQCELCD